ncbi:hypothetical protein [Sphingomonas alpina]|uniref:Uncharacterized protein n=1 Tax=Sphingomonas alpina TaxID=653931 RepID=A0A7H0LH77_9SPHN|nr:hypothetical protein [Sphingomonas alpina]QNQ09030.1 hypothetical protein H3Z74_20420 [Sphingomonas alpina]
MNRYLAAGLSLVLLLPAMPVAASTLDYDCDSTGGRFSALKTTQSGNVNKISGVLTARNMIEIPRWGAVGNVALSSADGKNSIQLQLAGFPSVDAQAMTASIILTIGGEKTEVEIGKSALLQPMPFTISVDASGSATIAFAGVQKNAIVVLGPAPVARVSCSTGEFIFEKLDLGN